MRDILLPGERTWVAVVGGQLAQINDGARRFYERHGFVPAEFTDGAANEERAPDVRYVWPTPGLPLRA